MKDFSVIEWLVIRNITLSEAIMNIIIALVCVAILVSFWTLHRKNGFYKNFNMVSLIINKEGYLDGAKCMEIGTFAIMTWVVVTMTIKGTISDALIAAYVGAFAARGAFGAYMRAKGSPEQIEGTTAVTTTRVDTRVDTMDVVKTPHEEPPKPPEVEKKGKKK